jgi:hypothetical protein
MLQTLMIVSLLILSSCSSKPPEPISETIYVKQYIPLDLLRIDCLATPAGDTVRSLALSWNNNTGCLRAHQKLLEGLIKNYTKEGGMEDEHKPER